MKKIGAKQILKYTLLPGIFPRMRMFFDSGFGTIGFLIAQIFRAARIFDDAHPYLNPANIGRFGISHVFADAGSRLKFKRGHYDQIAIYALMLGGIVLMFAQVFLFGLALFTSSAHAQQPVLPGTFAGYFQLTADQARYDIAHQLLDRVFGLDNFFHSCVDLEQSCRPPDGTSAPAPPEGTFPYPFHKALHGMLAFYSVGLMVFAVLLFIYFIIAVAAETAQTGTPFGRRFNHVWAPLRMVMALGLLVPLSPGLNSAQWILMFAARFGSDFATNGWYIFVDTATGGGGGAGNTNTIGGPTESLVAIPSPPPLNAIMEFMTTAAACKIGEENIYKNTEIGAGIPKVDAYLVNADLMTGSNVLPLIGTTLDDALTASNFQDIRISFGQQKPSGNSENAAKIDPVCGLVILPITDVTQTNSPGSRKILEAYWAMLQDMWRADSPEMTCNGGAPPAPGGSPADPLWPIAACYDAIHLTNGHANGAQPPANLSQTLAQVMQAYNDRVSTAITIGTNLQSSAQWAMDLRQRGWAGAGIWYNKIAELNGTLIGAAYNLPTVVKYPKVMEEVKTQRLQNDRDITGPDRFNPVLSKGQEVKLQDQSQADLAKALYSVQQIWFDNYSTMQPSGNIFIDAINLVFGLQGLFNIYNNGGANGHAAIHPLAQLAAVGKGIVDASIRNLGWSVGAGLMGGIANLFNESLPATIFSVASKFLTQIALMGLSIGFVLYYIIPFLPFMYFFFSVGRWIKSIFEAMVGMPLWALAHIRIDGEGLPGDAAMQGYYMIFEIFLRPILLVFGLLAGITIFAAQVRILNDIWPLVTSNLTGFSTENLPPGGETPTSMQVGSIVYLRSALDRFFYTVVYAITCYMMALASFKLIDLVPEHILRWMGTSVHIFGEDNGDPAGHLIRNTTVGANTIAGSAQNIIGNAQATVSKSASFARNFASGNLGNPKS
jgi:conjugal transfer/type IV secretion protein DotA/TraY